MKEKNDIKIFIIPTIISILILISIILGILYVEYIRNLTSKNILKNLGELAKQEAENISDKMQEHKRILETIINQIDIKTEDEVFKKYNTNAGKDEFSRIAILYKDGKTSTSDGTVVDLSQDINYFFQTNEIQISKTRLSKVDKKEINIYSKKISWNNQEEVVILLVVETDKYENLFLQSIYNGKGIEYLITVNGEIIANSNKEENGINIFEKLKENNKNKINKNLKNIEKMEQEINKTLNGQMLYKEKDNNFYIAYQKLGINEWYLIIRTPGSVVAEELNKILKMTLIITNIIISIIFIISLYIIINNKKKKDKLFKLAYIDKITKIGNKNYFMEESQKLLESNFENIYLIVLDINKFKSFNKEYGHKRGNELLLNIGKILTKKFNKESIISRLANDIFAIIFESKEDINKISENIIENVSKIKIENEKYQIYVSLGIYKIKKGEKIIEKILDKALLALDKVKGNYNKQYMIYDELLEKEIEKEHEIELNMQQALDNQEFVIYYQPKISTRTKKIEGAEALVRWIRNNKVIPPNEFIPLFEKNKFIIKLDTYIFNKVCEDLKEWKRKYNNIPLISVNISKEHIVKEDFIKDYLDIAKKNKIDSKEIELEITETATMERDIVMVMKKIKKAGFIISIDDFGTGYSSLSMLQNMPIDKIKIDKTFIDQINIKSTKKNIIKYIIFIAKQLKIKTVAEGVESLEQVEYLEKIGCDTIQGYYYSKPLSKNDFEVYKEHIDGL